MKKFLSILILIFISRPLPAQEGKLHDVFPLEVGMKWTYLYKSSVILSWHGIMVEYNKTDSGTVKYEIMKKTENDTMIIWNIKEQDSIRRRIHPGDYFGPKDTSYLIINSSIINLFENKRGNHELSISSNYPIWEFPFSWKNHNSEYESKMKIYRYSVDSILRIVECINIRTDWFCWDTLVFQNNLGLTKLFSGFHAGTSAWDDLKANAYLIDFPLKINYQENRFPINYILFQNYPNPFNPTTNIDYEIPAIAMVKISIYDILGREIKVLVNEKQHSGRYTVTFDGKGLPSGIYMYRLSSGRYNEIKKLILLK